MEVKVLAEVLHTDAGALDVPAGIANAPRGLPLELLIVELGLCEPEHEISLVALVSVLLNTLSHADLEIFLAEISENVVFLELGGVEIDVAAGFIGVALVHK